jgi:hypothetical protein
LSPLQEALESALIGQLLGQNQCNLQAALIPKPVIQSHCFMQATTASELRCFFAWPAVACDYLMNCDDCTNGTTSTLSTTMLKQFNQKPARIMLLIGTSPVP